MSALTRPGGGTIGTPVDPASPSGILIDPYTEIGQTPLLDEVIKGDGLGGWTIGLPPGGPPSGVAGGDLSGTYANPTVKTKRLVLEFASPGRVMSAGVRYLDREAIACSLIPTLLHAAWNLIGISIVVDLVDASRTYDVEVVSNPHTGSPAIIGTALTVPLSTLSASTRALTTAVPVNTLWGVRIVRATGSGLSTFTRARVEIEVEMP